MSGPLSSENIGTASSIASIATVQSAIANVQSEIVNIHSKSFSPSSSHTWIKCPYSAIARQQIPDKSSFFSETGSLAHEYCEIKVKLYFGQITSAEYAEREEKIRANPLYTPDMLANSDTYLETIKELSISEYNYPPIVYVEQQVKYDDICGEDGFGTADCILLGGNTLTVIDYKNGSGVPVSAYANPQMMLYAYGALHSIVNPAIYDIRKIVMCIVQPNLGEPSVQAFNIKALLAWIDAVVKPAVAKIKAGCRDRVPGKWCKDGFCPNFTQCSAWIAKFAEVYADYETEYSDKEVDSLSTDELGDIYGKVVAVKGWMDKLSKRIETLLNENQPVKGWKLVPGRSTRYLTDVDKAYTALSAEGGIDSELLYSRVPVTLTEAEKIVGKKEFGRICEPYIGKKPGKPTVVPSSDPREPIDRSAASDFEGLEQPVTEAPPSETPPAEDAKPAKKTRTRAKTAKTTDTGGN